MIALVWFNMADRAYWVAVENGLENSHSTRQSLFEGTEIDFRVKREASTT